MSDHPEQSETPDRPTVRREDGPLTPAAPPETAAPAFGSREYLAALEGNPGGAGDAGGFTERTHAVAALETSAPTYIPPAGIDASQFVVGDPAPVSDIAGPQLAELAQDTIGARQAERAARIDMGQVRDELLAWLKTLVSAAVYAVLIVTFGFQVARVEGRSMAPTLEDQDRLIVNKLVYRIADPRRGDIVMLYYPLDPEKSFVKRVIAEENDTVRIVDGRVYVNDVPLHDDYVPDDYRSHDDWGPQVIPEGYYFVMGDHRNNSSDSRHWGMVPKKYIIGKVQIRWWPVPQARVFH